MRLSYLGPASIVSGLVLLGCSGSEGDADRIDVYPVSGKVTLGSAPVAGATVTYSPKGSYPAAFGISDAGGNYKLTTYEDGDGAAAGEYTVLVTKAAPAAASPSAGGHDAYVAGGAAASHGARGGANAAPGSLLPQKYMSAETSDLAVTVKTGGDNVIDLKLNP